MQPPRKRMDNKYVEEEPPMVFATRRDPDIFVCEFADRIEVYRKKGERVKLLEILYK